MVQANVQANSCGLVSLWIKDTQTPSILEPLLRSQSIKHIQISFDYHKCNSTKFFKKQKTLDPKVPEFILDCVNVICFTVSLGKYNCLLSLESCLRLQTAFLCCEQLFCHAVAFQLLAQPTLLALTFYTVCSRTLKEHGPWCDTPKMHSSCQSFSNSCSLQQQLQGYRSRWDHHYLLLETNATGKSKERRIWLMTPCSQHLDSQSENYVRVGLGRPWPASHSSGFCSGEDPLCYVMTCFPDTPGKYPLHCRPVSERQLNNFTMAQTGKRVRMERLKALGYYVLPTRTMDYQEARDSS